MTPPATRPLSQTVGLVGGLIVFAVMLSVAPPEGLSVAGWRVLCVGVLMTVFWFTEAIPVTLTGVVPFMALPLLGVSPADKVAASYFTPVLFLILGGFFMATAMEKWGMHKRIALAALARAGGSARSILLAVMATTAFISMFVSNSAATLAMLPVALAIVAATLSPGTDEGEHRRFGQAMVLGIAYGATLGGFGLIIGSPGNAAAVAIFQKVYDQEIGFALWAAFGLPLVILSVPLAWLLLSRLIFPFRLAGMDRDAVRGAVGDPGHWSATDIRLVTILCIALAAWIGMPFVRMAIPAMSDPHVAMLAAVALFLVPAGPGKGPLLTWNDTRVMPWHLLVLLGGGLALAEAIKATDLSQWLQLQFAGATALSPFVQLAVLALATLFVTEFVTNTATVSAFLPATVALAGSGHIDPVTLGMVTAFAANWGFMMPAGTPSLALAYGTGRLTVPQMAWSGFFMDAGGVLLILAVVLGVGAVVL
ncbi:SLC13 family permease [Sandaracinobacteroides saxicola]|uniref:DASS family sodium-coupled anion symporter n=1 Tax=Sandaracinobacteroides saxicola TaxID=2759707 RepID=A0A7G5IM53_9SPHN|nr:DASS family sodium-coupled anion symporter [Sandaracinobacteroides saxicola]QMW24445.1 DASS family sodium-coupled anion symporter [Sandaracinobacteroides saxicola]